jgi:hypothetical protein
LLLGALAGMAVAVAADEVLPGWAAFTLLVSIGLTWRRDDPPIFPFIFVYQWVSITSGYWFQQVAGFFPGLYRPGDDERTKFMALTGLVILAAGIRVMYHGLTVWLVKHHGPDRASESWAVGNLQGLFVIVVASYTVDYFWVINTKAVPGLDVALQRVLDLRQVLFVTLLWEVLRRRQGYTYLWLAVGWAFVPRLGSYFSEFKSPLLLLLITYAWTFRPWDRRWWPKSLLALAKASPVLAVLLVLLLIWQGGLKRDTRLAIEADTVSASPVDRFTRFAGGVTAELPNLFKNPLPYVQQLVERLSYITFFSLVLDHVPDREPYAQGEMLKLAVTNSVVPRYLFPEKPVLLSDSAYTRRFAGVQVEEEGTSISIGYMAEFYADWGLRGMWLSIFGYGCWIGLAAGVLRRLNRMPILHAGMLIVAMLTIADFEHQFVKGFAAINASVGFMLVLVFALRPWLSRLLDVRAVAPESGANAARSATDRPAGATALGG